MAIDHGDLKPENIIVDDAYNITWYDRLAVTYFFLCDG
jgi:hypothetical protein